MKISILPVTAFQAPEHSGLTRFHQLIVPLHELNHVRNSRLSIIDVVWAMMHHVKPPVPAEYNEAAAFMRRQISNLVLFGITGSASKFPGLASWSPDWTQRLQQGLPIH